MKNANKKPIAPPKKDCNKQLDVSNFETFTKEEYITNLERLGLCCHEHIVGEEVYYSNKTYGLHKVIRWDKDRGEYILQIHKQRFWSNPFRIHIKECTNETLEVFEANMDRLLLTHYDENMLMRSDFVVKLIDVLNDAIKDYEATYELFRSNDVHKAVKLAKEKITYSGVCWYVKEKSIIHKHLISKLCKAYINERDYSYVSTPIDMLYAALNYEDNKVYTDSISKRIELIRKIVKDLMYVKVTHETRVHLLYLKSIDNHIVKYKQSRDLDMNLGLCVKFESYEDRYHISALKYIPVVYFRSFICETIGHIYNHAEYTDSEVICREMNESIDTRLELLNEIDKNIYSYLKEKYNL